jgi:hypothetical protein
MEMEMKQDLDLALGETLGQNLGHNIDRLAAAASLLEQAAERIAASIAAQENTLTLNAEATIGRIVATVEARHDSEIEQKLAAVEQRIAELEARAAEPASASAGRKTLPSSMTTLLARQGLSAESFEHGSIEAGSLDAALSSLSLEQRIAVKSQLIRAGVLG